MKIIYVIGGLPTEASGVGRIVCDLANAFGRAGTPITVYTAECRGPAAAHLVEPPSTLVALPGRWMGRLAWSPALKRRLAADMADVDVVHNHNLWMLPNLYASQLAARHAKPVIFTAMGFLEPWALERSRWKKRLMAWAFQDRQLRRAACIQVNSRHELGSVRAYGLTNPVAIVPNGVDPRPFDALPDPAEVVARHGLAGKKVALFLSRLHEKKGLGHLVEAWARVAPDAPDWQLVLAGPDDGYEATIRARVVALGLGDRVTFTGLVTGETKLATLAAADVFVLPSFSEGFAMAILEALAAGLPTLLTPGCNFPEVARSGAGVEVEPTEADTERGLRQLIEMSDDERAEASRRARALIAASYTWDRIALQLRGVYEWMAGGGDRPGFVEEG